MTISVKKFNRHVKATEKVTVSMSIGNEYKEMTFHNMKKAYAFFDNIKRDGVYIENSGEIEFKGYQDFGETFGCVGIYGTCVHTSQFPDVEIPYEYSISKIYRLWDMAYVSFPSEGIRIECTEERANVYQLQEGYGKDTFELYCLLRMAYQLYRKANEAL
jgi:hypothetical protein